MSCACSNLSLNRWLVRNQQSPQYYPTGIANNETATQQPALNVWRDYIWLGITHIIPKGWDHVLFVLGLLLGMHTARQLIIWISGFTLAHTLTLGLVAKGAIAVPSQWVEPAIALTIAWVAVENLMHPPKTYLRLAVVFAFGLIHGLGFAGVLKEMGFPPGDFTTALIGFNVGVEVAQLAIVLLGWIIYRTWANPSAWRRRVALPGSVLIAATGLHWAVVRLVG